MALKIYCESDVRTHTIRRVISQAKATAPDWVSFTGDLKQADLRIILGIGIDGVAQAVKQTPSIVLQLCYKTSGGSRSEWYDIWKKCVMVGSYYRLVSLPCPFVRFPLGFDPEVFYPAETYEKNYVAITTGYVDGPEEIRSVYQGFGRIAHVGENFRLGPGYHHFANLSDDQMRQVYQNSVYVCGLRRIEGFELPIIEGAACGCLPIAFDLPCYRYWFNDLAYFISPYEDVKKQLAKVFRRGAGEYKREHNLERFYLHNAWQPFWDMLRSCV